MFRLWGYPRPFQPTEQHRDNAEDCCEWDDSGQPGRKQPQNDLRLTNNGFFFNVQAERLS